MPLSRLRARKARPPTVSWRSGFATTASPGRRIAGPSANLCFRPFAFAGRCLKVVVPPCFVLPKRTRRIAQLFDGSKYGPEAVLPNEHAAQGGVAPQWLEQRLAASDIAGVEADALLDRAPLDVRVNTLKADRTALALPVETQPTVAPNGSADCHRHAGRTVDRMARGQDRGAGHRLAAGLPRGRCQRGRNHRRSLRWRWRQDTRAGSCNGQSRAADCAATRIAAVCPASCHAPSGQGQQTSRHACSIRSVNSKRLPIWRGRPTQS